jgi:hypothetical protein
MKTLLTIFLLLISLSISGQRYAVYVCAQPADLGLGIRADLGYTYGSISYGNWGAYKDKYIHNHTKVTVGGLIPLKKKKDHCHEISIGVNYHNADYPEGCPKRLTRTISCEAGWAIYISRISIGARTDIPRWEPCIDVGLYF